MLTHAHQDHVGAAYMFSRVYLLEKDWPLLDHINRENLELFVKEIGEKGAFEAYGFGVEVNCSPLSRSYFLIHL